MEIYNEGGGGISVVISIHHKTKMVISSLFQMHKRKKFACD